MPLLPLALLVTTALLACGAKSECDAETLAAGAIQGQIDGVDWVGSTAVWSWAGDAANVTTAEADGWRFTLVAGVDAGGSPLSQVLEPETEVEVPLGDGNMLIAYPTGVAGSYTANDAGSGTMLVKRIDDALAICFDATATASDGSAIEITGGMAHASCASTDGCD